MILTAVYGDRKSKIYIRKEKVELSEILKEFAEGEIFAIEHERLPLELGEGYMVFEHRITYDEDVETFITENTISKEDVEKIKEYRLTYFTLYSIDKLLYDTLEKFKDYKCRVFSTNCQDNRFFIIVQRKFNSIEELREEKRNLCCTYEPITHDILMNSIPHESIGFYQGEWRVIRLTECQELPAIERITKLDRKKKEATFQTDKGTIEVKGNEVVFKGRFTSKDIGEWEKKIYNEVPEWCPTVEDVMNAYKTVLGEDVSNLVNHVLVVPRVMDNGKLLSGRVVIMPKDESKAGLLIGKEGWIAKKVSELLDGYYIKIRTSRDDLRNKLNKLVLELLLPSGE